MESAIDAHLKCPRTRTRRVGDDFQPPYPAFSARAPQTMTQVVMGYFGVQSRGGGEMMATAFKAVNALFDLPDGPDHRDTVRYIDGDGYDTAIVVAYWGDTKQFARWVDNPQNQAWWNADERSREGVGYFREILSPRDAQYETAYSSAKHLEGVGVVMGGVSGEILEHGYWGSMRDRIPLSQTDTMSPTGGLSVRADGNGRVTVTDTRTSLSSARARTGRTRKARSAASTWKTSSRHCAPAWIFYAIRVPKSAATATAMCSTSMTTVAR
jgi:aldoxime dehydratase